MTTDRVVVVGAGPVGLVTALGLARRGLAVTVIEREDDVFRSPRAMGYHWGARTSSKISGCWMTFSPLGFPRSVSEFTRTPRRTMSI